MKAVLTAVTAVSKWSFKIHSGIVRGANIGMVIQTVSENEIGFNRNSPGKVATKLSLH
jgi:hypothetical protein